MAPEFPKTYDPQAHEDRIYEQWLQSGLFNPDNLEGEPFSIVMPPPNVTGTLHMGHAAMLALEDIMIRFNRMQGKKTLWLPGTDHAAIATQTKVEKILQEQGLNRHGLGRDQFLAKVNQFAQQSHDTIKNQIIKLGSSCDWSREAYTLDATRTKAVRSVFKMMHDDGLIFRGNRVVNWCPRCHSTLADDEVEYAQEKGRLYWLKYGPFLLATSRPETKLGDTAVAVYPGDERYKDMVGKKYMIPGVLGEFEITVVADRAVDPEFGSGAIKVTPAHDFTDYQIAKRHGIAMKQIIDEDGKMMANCGKYAGLTTREAREAIVADMQELGLIDHIEDNYDHNIAVCYRCGTQIEPIPSLQWFIDVNKEIPRYGKSLKQLSIDSVRDGIFGRKKINIIPERFEKNYFHWMENLQDWCISRQIWFGHQIPVWHKDGNEPYVGIDAPSEAGWTQDTDTLDTWFSSGLWTFSTLAQNPEQISIENGKLVVDSEDFRNFHPTDVLETGYDILFFWVARMIIMTTYAIGDIPFQNVYLHGLVRDEKGKKMSKSLGNVIDPLDMIARFGTDATRLSLVVGATPGIDMKLSEEKIKSFRNFANKLWNISRYILSADRDASQAPPAESLLPSDVWIMQKFSALIGNTGGYLEKYQFSQASEKLSEFTWNDLADWYLEVAKFESNQEVKSWLLKNILSDLLKLWHPFIPFVTEAIWSNLHTDRLLMAEKWPTADPYWIKTQESRIDNQFLYFNKLKEIIVAIRNIRLENKLDLSSKLSVIARIPASGNQAFKTIIDDNQELIKKMRTGVGTIQVEISDEVLEDAYFASVGDVNIYVPFLGTIDVSAEKQRIEKEIANLDKYIAGLETRLNEPTFLAKAPAQIVQQQQSSLTEAAIKLAEYKKKLATLQ